MKQTKKRLAGKKPPLKKMSDSEFARNKGINPYVVGAPDPRHVSDPWFYNNFQSQIYHEILMRKKTDNFVMQHSIHLEHMTKKPDYFGEALSICEEFGLLRIMDFNQKFDVELVAQFFATVHFGNEEVRTVTWMSRGKVLITQ